MARDNRVHMPSSGAGITRYFDEFKSKVQISPMTVVVILIVIILLVLLLHRVGYGFLGIQNLS